MRRHLTLIGALSVAMVTLAPGAGMAWQAENRLEVNALSDGSFEVVGKPGSSPADYWCAAGDYVLRVQGITGTRRIYVTRPRGPSQTTTRKSAVQFSLSLPAGIRAHDGVFLTVRRAGANLSVAVATNYCIDHKSLDF